MRQPQACASASVVLLVRQTLGVPAWLQAYPSCCPGDSLGAGLRDAEVLVWMGDFNYRLCATYEWAVARAEAGALGELLSVDQLRQEMGRGIIFHGLVGAWLGE